MFIMGLSKSCTGICERKKTNDIDHLIKFEYDVVVIIQQFLDRLKLRSIF